MEIKIKGMDQKKEMERWENITQTITILERWRDCEAEQKGRNEQECYD
jgi:hypothetical protein